MADLSAVIGDGDDIQAIITGNSSVIGVAQNVLPQVAQATSNALPWNTVSKPGMLIPNQAAFIDSLSLVNLDLPLLDAGDRIVIYCHSAAGFRLNQIRPTDVMEVGNKRTTPGLSGGIRSTDRGDAIEAFRASDSIIVRILSGNPEVF